MNWVKLQSGTSRLESRGYLIAWVRQVAGQWFGYIDRASVHLLGPFSSEKEARQACRDDIRANGNGVWS